MFKRGTTDQAFIDKFLGCGEFEGGAARDVPANGNVRETNPLVQRLIARKRPAMEIFAKDTDLKIPENLNVGQRQAYKAQKFSELDDATKATFEAKALAEAEQNQKVDTRAAFEYISYHNAFYFHYADHSEQEPGVHSADTRGHVQQDARFQEYTVRAGIFCHNHDYS